MLTPDEAAELAAREELEARLPTFHEFMARYRPKYFPPPEHLQPVFDLMERTRYERVFATVSEPPRHGKTETCKGAVAWRNLCDPAERHFYCTYGDDLASLFGRSVRQLASEEVGVLLDPSSKAVDDWHTTFGGGLKSTSVGGPITGRGCNGGLIIADDTIKSMVVAMSKAERDKVSRWLANDVNSRLEGGSSMLVWGTRWHEDDPIGRIKRGEILAGYKWEHYNLPAIHDGNFRPVDERERPDLANPLWLSVDSEHPNDRAAALRWYKQIRASDEYGWWALYQGNPRPMGKQLFQEPQRFLLKKFEYQGKRILIICDPAATDDTRNDHSAIIVLAAEGYGDEMKVWVIYSWRGHVEIPDLVKKLREVQVRFWNAPIAVESVQGFKAVPQMLRRIDKNLRIREVKPIGDKFTRAQPAAAAWNTGRIFVALDSEPVQRVGQPPTTSADELIAEAMVFTGLNDKEDDQVDALAHGFNELRGVSPAGRGAVRNHGPFG